jgi:hypothetical protein
MVARAATRDAGLVGIPPPRALVPLDVLDQRPSLNRVEQLQAAANRENREAALKCLAQQGTLELVSGLIQFLCLRTADFAVSPGWSPRTEARL